MQQILAIDAGGTSTRAVILDSTGRCLGYGRAGPGNPLSSGFDAALASLGAATAAAVTHAGSASVGLASALVAMAGASTQMNGRRFRDQLATHGLQGELVIESDLLAVYFSGTFHSDGYALVAGTGAVAARIRQSRLDAVGDGLGWLLGDSGAGYWIGHRVARAVAADLDGRGPATGLTSLLLAAIGIRTSLAQRNHGRPVALQQLIDALYVLRPVELSRFAPLAFSAPDDDVAGRILAEAGTALAATLAAVRDPSLAGPAVPVVLGGSILRHGSPLAERVESSLAGCGSGDLIRVGDGVAGAAVLALMRAGITIDEAVFGRIRSSLAGLRTD